MKLKKFTEKQYQKFSLAEGSNYIASEYALYKILQVVKTFKPQNILEAGVGIGTISDSILKADLNYKPKVYGTESERFCLQQLPQNLGEDYDELELYPDIQALPSMLKFDLIIIDGKDKCLSEVKGMMSAGCIVIVEGDRKDQTELLNNLFSASKFVHSITSKKNSSYSNRPGNHYQGGVKIIFTNPDRKQYLEWIKLKVMAKLHFQLRKIF